MISRAKQRNHFNSKLEHGRVKVNMAREGWRSEGGLLSDNCDNGLIGQWGPGDTGGGGQQASTSSTKSGEIWG